MHASLTARAAFGVVTRWTTSTTAAQSPAAGGDRAAPALWLARAAAPAVTPLGSTRGIECHGDPPDCKDPSLRCSGLRDGNTVLVYAWLPARL